MTKLGQLYSRRDVLAGLIQSEIAIIIHESLAAHNNSDLRVCTEKMITHIVVVTQTTLQ